MFEELNKRREAVAANIAKSFENDIEKARSGIYEDTPENRRLNRVGQQYGSKKKEEEPAGKSKSGGESGSYEHYAKQASDSALRRAAADDNAKPGVQEAANKEIKRRKETNKKNQQNNSWADKLKNVDIPVNVVDENFNFMNAKFNHYGNSDFGFSFAGYKDAKTGKLDVDLDDIYGLEPDQINEIHSALKSKFESDNAENKQKEKSKPKNEKKPKRQNPTALIKLGKDKAKKENKAVIAGIDEDGQQFFDDARNYAAGTDLDRVLYTIYPDGAYDVGFVEQKSALETLLDEDPTAYEKIAYSGLSNEDWLKKVSQGEDKTLADAAKERLQDLKKVKDVMTAFDDITMDDDEFDVLVDSIVGKSGAALKLRKTILSKDFNDDNDKRKAYESAIEQLVWMMKS